MLANTIFGCDVKLRLFCLGRREFMCLQGLTDRPLSRNLAPSLEKYLNDNPRSHGAQKRNEKSVIAPITSIANVSSAKNTFEKKRQAPRVLGPATAP